MGVGEAGDTRCNPSSQIRLLALTLAAFPLSMPPRAPRSALLTVLLVRITKFMVRPPKCKGAEMGDEYATASEKDPKILLTTSREPSQRLGQFVKELKLVFPNAARMNRGSQVISEIIEFCRAHEYTDVIFVHEHRGEPDNLVICHLPFGPTAFFELLNVLGQRTANILKHLFTVPKPETKRIITFANKSDYISFSLQISSTPELKLMKCGSSGLNAY
ncbi:hypothetical protein ZIOFF_043631 [Zingiber officinale]|uniref:Brix domain-containing protein n=1 Tax=Zingiber officinale TaxID=94328 RepID=A0A8J5KQQ3_ZINOF|nr:hypothetical protein ZIOFF_043631 [Zingiber officinale]